MIIYIYILYMYIYIYIHAAHASSVGSYCIRMHGSRASGPQPGMRGKKRGREGDRDRDMYDYMYM